jgi:ATP-binding cassette subfamily B protein
MTRFLVRLLAGRPRPYLMLETLWIVLRVTILLAGLLLQAVFDHLSGYAQAGFTIWTLVALLVASETVRLVLWYGVVLSRAEPGYWCTVRAGLQDRVVDHALHRPAAVALDRPAGDVVSRLGGDADQVSVFSIWSISNISRLVIALAALVILLTINPLATAGLVVPVVAVTLAGRALSGPVGRYQEAARSAAGEVSTIVGEVVGGMQALKVARAEDRVVERVRRAGDVRLRAEVRGAAYASVQESVFRSTAAFGTGLVLLLVAGQMRGGQFTVGDFALFVFYIQFVTEAVNALGMFMGRVKRATVSLERISELAGGPAETVRCEPVYLDREPPPAPAPPDREPLRSLTVAGLSYRHPGTDRGVHDVELTLAPGTVTVVTGRVGSGKSTLVQALLGLLPADEGEIRWNGVVLAEPGEFFVPPRVAYLPQVPRLFSGTLRENIVLGADHPADAVDRAVELAAFGPDLAELPDGLETVVGPRGLRLSGGQLQRVATARMILRDPELMVVDDLSNALDVDTERELCANLVATGRAVLAVSNRPELLATADQVVVLDEGRVVSSGPPELAGVRSAGETQP